MRLDGFRPVRSGIWETMICFYRDVLGFEIQEMRTRAMCTW